MKFKRENVGKIFQDERGHLYRMVAYSDQPTVVLDPVNMADEDGRLEFGIYSKFAEGWTLLVPEDKDSA